MLLHHISSHTLDTISLNSLRVVSRYLAKSSNNDHQGKKEKNSSKISLNRIIGVSDILPDLRANIFKQFNGHEIFDQQSSYSNSYPFLSIAKYSVPVVRERAQVVSKLVEELNYPAEKVTLRLVNRYIFWEKILGQPPVAGKAAKLITLVNETSKFKAKVKTLAKIDNQLRRLLPGEHIDEKILTTKREIESELENLKHSVLHEEINDETTSPETVEHKSTHSSSKSESKEL